MSKDIRDALALIEDENQELAAAASRLLKMVKAQCETTSPWQYRCLMEQLGEIRDLWMAHLQSAGQVFPSLFFYPRRMSASFSQFEKTRAELRHQLDSVCDADWPRSIALGLQAARVRANEILPAILTQLEKEKSTVRVLLRRGLAFPSAHDEPARSQMASA